MTDYKQLCAELVHIADALDSGTELASNQGQAMDGYSALAAFRDVAYRARAALAETEPEDDADSIPDCMSEVIGKWVINVQDAMPHEMRNSAEWKRLLPLAAGTGRQHEKERLEIIFDWMWNTVLPTLQPIADKHGFGEEWRMMLQQRTAAAAADAADAADAAAYARVADAAYAAICAAANAADAADARVADAAYAAICAAADAADAANAAAAASTDSAAAWQQFNPCGLLQRLIEEGVTNP